MKFLKALAVIIAFFGCAALVIIGQAHEGIGWLGLMLLGLAGLLVLLFLYNRRYTRADRLQKKQMKAREQEQRRGQPHA